MSRYELPPDEDTTDRDWERLYRAVNADEDDLRDYRPIQPEPSWRSLVRRLWAPAAIAFGLVLKFGFATLKFFGIFISVGAYALIWGWRFAVGLVALIFVHELGHWLEARRQGLHPSAPVFIPLLGAYVAIKDAPDDPWRNGLIALAGPLVGSLGAAAAWGLGEQLDSDLLVALAYTGFLLNLFNLIPVAFLDGGFAWRAIKALREPQLEVDAGGAAVAGASRARATVLGAYYLGLAAACALGMWATHVPQTRL